MSKQNYNKYISNSDLKDLIKWMKVQFALRYVDETKINIDIGLIDYCKNDILYLILLFYLLYFLYMK